MKKVGRNKARRGGNMATGTLKKGERKVRIKWKAGMRKMGRRCEQDGKKAGERQGKDARKA
jgi:hypothetical protein